MLDKAVAALKADKAGALAQFTKGEGGFKDRDLYPFCGGPDGKFTAHPKLVGKSLKELKDKAGKALGAEMYKVAQEGKIAEVAYMWPRPGATEPGGEGELRHQGGRPGLRGRLLQVAASGRASLTAREARRAARRTACAGDRSPTARPALPFSASFQRADLALHQLLQPLGGARRGVGLEVKYGAGVGKATRCQDLRAAGPAGRLRGQGRSGWRGSSPTSAPKRGCWMQLASRQGVPGPSRSRWTTA